MYDHNYEGESAEGDGNGGVPSTQEPLSTKFNRWTKNAEESVYFRFTSRITIMICSIVLAAAGPAAWKLVDIISGHSKQLTEQGEQLKALESRVDTNYQANHDLMRDLFSGVKDINTLILNNAPNRYTKADAAVDRQSVTARMEELGHRVDRLESRIEDVQGDVNSIQRASEVPLGGKRK